jgi:ABC-type transport system substrate-binding protein
MEKKLIISSLILTLIALPLLAACGPKEAPTATPAPTSTPAPPAAVSINVAYPGGFTGLTGVDPCDFFGAAPPGVFEALVAQDKDEKLYGLLAESWSWSDDGLTLTVKLRKGIKFSSGDPFTTADVEFSLLRHSEKDMPVIAPGLSQSSSLTTDSRKGLSRASRKEVKGVWDVAEVEQAQQADHPAPQRSHDFG